MSMPLIPMNDLIGKPEFFQMIDLVVTPIIIFNERLEYSHINKAFMREVGYLNADEIRTVKEWSEKAYPDVVYREAIDREWQNKIELAASAENYHANLCVQVQKANGKFCWYDLHENRYGDFRILTFLDIDKLLQDNQQLDLLLKQQKSLLSVIVHDVRSPLSIIRHIICRDQIQELTEVERIALYEHLEMQIEQVFNIINSVLLKASAGRSGFYNAREDINILTFFKRHEGNQRERLVKANIKFNYDLSGDETVKFDLFALDTIVRNLLDNAIRFSPQNGVVTVSFLINALSNEVVICDQGPGMRFDQIERIMNNQATFKYKKEITDGFGLGLVMAKEILELYGGNLFVEANASVGTTFRILLPRDVEVI